jgi:hydrogenase assembly chaperone HypC/HupF
MCRVTPVRVARIDGDTAWLELDGRVVSASLATTETIHVGDYVMHYAGLILERLDSQEAESILEALAAMDDAAAAGDWVPLHWGWVCERITDLQQRQLECFTRHHLQLASATL